MNKHTEHGLALITGASAGIGATYMLIDVGEMVDAALTGLDLGETVTIPSLPEASDWNAFSAMRLGLAPRLSLRRAASRYGRAGS